jgi:hypothetical protein
MKERESQGQFASVMPFISLKFRMMCIKNTHPGIFRTFTGAWIETCPSAIAFPLLQHKQFRSLSESPPVQPVVTREKYVPLYSLSSLLS